MALLRALGRGVTLREACARVDISRQTYYEQRQRDPVFAGAVDYLRGRKQEPDVTAPVPAWWLLAQGIPLLRAPRNQTAPTSPPDRHRRARVGRSLQDHGLTLRQIGHLLADAEGLDSPLTDRQVTYAIRQARGGAAKDQAADDARVAYGEFERANQATAEAGGRFYAELRALKFTPDAAAARVRALATRDETDFADLPREVGELATTIVERATHRDELRRVWDAARCPDQHPI